MDPVDVSRLKEGEVNLGTSIMAVSYNGGVVLGADSRTTMGSYIANRVTDKLTHISDRIYCCRSGSAADTQAVADVITYYLDMYGVESESGHVGTEMAANLFSQLVYGNKDRLSAGIIVAGWDKKKGGTVFNVPLGGGVFQQPWAIGGSGSSYIYGYCDSTWQPGWGKEQTLEFVKNALSLAMSRDGSSGGTIRMVDITEEGVTRHFIPGNELPELSAKLV
ncbi:putative PRE3-20S proteasome subunit [Jaminaea rosea]|uniref:Proteasome subunit beta n=1 Tax=Jaminaea rosea TaxID=1569628 RepID=A0A316UP82_9BASI|nr:putative PRE3-20S proteasome subunit [Jaminaea rosea]PWN26578.1 putative PRE3-20S proteasome subunit [Jaminaea rosea]